MTPSPPQITPIKDKSNSTKMALLPTQMIAVLLLLSTISTCNCNPNTAVKSVLCNSDAYTKGDPFAISLDYVLAQLQSLTPSRTGYDFRNISPYPNAFAYGHAACNQTLTTSDCATCLAAAKTAMLATCDGQIGARGELYDCIIRYEQYPFDD